MIPQRNTCPTVISLAYKHRSLRSPGLIEEKSKYSLQELFNSLPITIAELARRSKVNEVTIARIRDRESIALRSTANKLLRVFSEVYGRPLTLDNVDFPVRG